MRISDWSSDVCSSDLCEAGTAVLVQVSAVGEVGQVLGQLPEQKRVADGGRAGGEDADGLIAHLPDRKSVVEGTSVSVRVDLGGRRIIKKKRKNIIRSKT